MMAQPSISSLTIYPIKSAAGIAVKRMTIAARGPVGDRDFMLIKPTGEFLTQRQIPSMARLQTELDDTGVLKVHFADSREQAVTVDPNAADLEAREVRVWRDVVNALDMGDTPADYLSEALGVPVRLVYMPNTTHRQIDKKFADVGRDVSFADGFPLLLISESALENLNTKLPFRIGMERFRPNLVVTGCEPHAEDNWRRLRIGGIEFDIVKPCERCVIPSIDPLSGEKQSEVTRALAAYRRDSQGKVLFGQNLLHHGEGTICLGDEVEVLE